jgi:hypothetical protein
MTPTPLYYAQVNGRDGLVLFLGGIQCFAPEDQHVLYPINTNAIVFLKARVPELLRAHLYQHVIEPLLARLGEGTR